VLAEDVKATFDAGCTMHLSKPIKKQTLVDALRDHLAAASSTAADMDPAPPASSDCAVSRRTEYTLNRFQLRISHNL
jgi:hypothetical protein